MKAKFHASEENREERIIEKERKKERESFGEWFLLDGLIRVGGVV